MTGGVNSMAPSEALACSQDAATSTLRKAPSFAKHAAARVFPKTPAKFTLLEESLRGQIGSSTLGPNINHKPC